MSQNKRANDAVDFIELDSNNIKIKPKDSSKAFIKEWSQERNISDFVVSATIEAVK